MVIKISGNYRVFLMVPCNILRFVLLECTYWVGKGTVDNCESMCLITLFVELYNVEFCVGASKSCHHQAVTVKLGNVRIKQRFRSPKFLGGSFHLHMKLGKHSHGYSLIC
jgi:hypothetical protein